jgi:hypothetical protein
MNKPVSERVLVPLRRAPWSRTFSRASSPRHGAPSHARAVVPPLFAVGLLVPVAGNERCAETSLEGEEARCDAFFTCHESRAGCPVLAQFLRLGRYLDRTRAA